MAVFHLREDESVAAGAVLHTVLLALWGNRDGQHIGHVGEGQGQQAAHVRVKRGKGMGEERWKKVPPHLGELAREWDQFLLLPFLYFSVPECSASVFFLYSQSNSCCSSLCFITFTCPLLADPPLCCCIQKSFSSPVRSPAVLCEGWIQKHTHTGKKAIVSYCNSNTRPASTCSSAQEANSRLPSHHLSLFWKVAFLTAVYSSSWSPYIGLDERGERSEERPASGCWLKR